MCYGTWVTGDLCKRISWLFDYFWHFILHLFLKSTHGSAVNQIPSVNYSVYFLYPDYCYIILHFIKNKWIEGIKYRWKEVKVSVDKKKMKFPFPLLLSWSSSSSINVLIKISYALAIFSLFSTIILLEGI